MPVAPDHEADSIRRHQAMQKELDTAAAEQDEARIRLLSARLEAQLKLEDFVIRFREAEHAKLKAWSPIFLPAAVALVLGILGLLQVLWGHHPTPGAGGG